MRRADRQHAAGGALGRDHPERLGEHARHDDLLGARQHARELAVVEPAGEDDALAHLLGRREIPLVAPGERLQERAQVGELVARAAFERAALAADVHQQPLVGALEPAQQHLDALAVRPEADDHELRAGLAREHARPGGEQQVDALRDDQLAHEADDRLALGVERREPVGRRRRRCRSRRRSRARPRAPRRRAACRAADGRARRAPRRPPGRNRCAPPSRAIARARRARSVADALSRGTNVCTSTPGRAEERPFAQSLQRHRRPQALGGVARADHHRLRGHEALARVRREPLVVRLERVLQRRPVDLRRVRTLAEAAREDRRAHQHVVRKARLRCPPARRRRAPPARSRSRSAPARQSSSRSNVRTSKPS